MSSSTLSRVSAWPQNDQFSSETTHNESKTQKDKDVFVSKQLHRVSKQYQGRRKFIKVVVQNFLECIPHTYSIGKRQ